MKSKNLLALGALTALLSAQTAHATNFICEGGVQKSIEDTSADAKRAKMEDVEVKNPKTGKIERLKEQLKGSELEYSINLPTAHLADLNFDFGVNRTSELTISGKYSQADVWRLGASTNLLGSDPGASLGLHGQITYVRQYNTRKESICKDIPWYNPINKVPSSAADFDLSREHSLKIGQLIEFETELTLGVPEWVSASLVDLKILSPFAMEGRFKVQLFRMTNNLVRVRVKTIDSATGLLGFKYRIFGSLPSLLGKRTEVRVVLHEVNLTEMNVLDTVFNFDQKLNEIMAAQGKKTAQELYDAHIGSRLQLKFQNTFKLLLEAVKLNLPVIDKYRKELMEELNVLVDASKEDALRNDGSYSYTDVGRRVYLISKAKARGIKRSTSINGAFFNLAQIKAMQYDYESFMSVTESEHKSNNFLLHGLGKYSQWKMFKLFGKTFGVSTNLILRAPEGINPKDYEEKPVRYANNGEGNEDFSRPVVETPKMPLPLTDVYGLHLSRQLKEQDFSAKEAKQLQQKLKDQLTDKIFESLTWYAPKDAVGDKNDNAEDRNDDVIVDARWDQFTSSAQSNVELNQDIVFKESIFKRYNPENPISQNEIIARIKEILLKKTNAEEDMKATPFFVKQNEGQAESGINSEVDKLRMLKSDRRYILAFDEDIKQVSGLLANILNSQDTRYRYEEYQKLIQNELFMEIGGIILMYVNADTLQEDVAVKIVLGAQSRAPIIGYFPNKETYEQLRVFGAVVDYQNQLTDRSYNLSNFFNEAGNPISLNDLLLKSKDVNLVDLKGSSSELRIK